MYYSLSMATTRIFKSGNSQAVRIPADMAYADTSVEFTIVRSGDVITMYPKRPSMEETIAALRALPSVPIEEMDERIEVPDRNWD